MEEKGDFDTIFNLTSTTVIANTLDCLSYNLSDN